MSLQWFVTYGSIRNDEMFAVQGCFDRVAFLQDDTDRNFKGWHGTSERPRPTRAWDGCYHALPDAKLVQRLSLPEFRQLAKRNGA